MTNEIQIPNLSAVAYRIESHDRTAVPQQELKTWSGRHRAVDLKCDVKNILSPSCINKLITSIN